VVERVAEVRMAFLLQRTVGGGGGANLMIPFQLERGGDGTTKCCRKIKRRW
jgi:hypothetical protein